MSDFFMSKYNTLELDTALRIGTSFDLIKRKIRVADRVAYLYYIDEFSKDELLEKIEQYFYDIAPDELSDNSIEFADNYIPYLEVETSTDTTKIATDILSGVLCLLIEGFDEPILIDSRTYPARGITEPEKDKSLRGSRDGFVETLVFNVGLIRRRIRDSSLTIETKKLGTSSKTDIAVCYMDSRVDKKLLKQVFDAINNCKIDALSMNSQSFVSAVFKEKWYHIFPRYKFTERPDSVAASILEGKICILVDNSPAAILLPITLFDLTEEANDFYFPRFTGTYLRLSRYIISVLSVILTPVYLLTVLNPSVVPDALNFIAIKEEINVPVFYQLLILEVAVDGMKLAAVNTPTMLSTPLSVIAALIIGDFSVQTGWFNAESMFYMATVTISNFTHQSYELGYAIKFMRIFLLFMVAFFKGFGFLFGIVLIALYLLFYKTIDGRAYLYPIVSLNIKEFIRRVTMSNKR